MADTLRHLRDPDLERALVELGSQLAYPATPDLASAVRVRLAATPTPPPAAPRLLARWFHWTWFAPPRRLVAVAMVALLLASIVVLALLPDTRTAIADRLGLRGVRIFFVEAEPTPESLPVGTGLALGRRVSLEEAREATSYAVHLPTLDDLGEPDEVYLMSRSGGGMVSFVYRSGPDLPASPYTGVGALLTQFRGETERMLIEKGLRFEKGMPPGTTLEAVAVDGELGFWIEGEAHFFMYRDPTGNYQEERFRLAGNVLLWERDGLTFRLESALPKEEALRIAESVRATEDG